MTNKKKLLIIHTGGTLGMNLTGEPEDAIRFKESLLKHAPRIFELADVDVEILFNKDSSNIRPSDWITLARRIDECMDKWDAFVVVHGTDTMSFTASALSYMIVNPKKPIIFTGSQRPLVDARSDAPRNLIYAVELAVEGRYNEVCIFFDSLLMRGNRSKKLSIPSFGAFDSPNFPALAKVGAHTEYSNTKLPEGPYSFDYRLETRVACMSLFPGFDVETFFTLTDKNIKGLVLQAFGPGDIPLGEGSVAHLIRHLTEHGIPTVICSQALYGRVDLSLYGTGRAALNAGAISAQDMTWEAALTKMMILLGHGCSLQTFRGKFLAPLAGELSEN
ncbi:MAG: asparaginase [Bdellovibrionota bacterium]